MNEIDSLSNDSGCVWHLRRSSHGVSPLHAPTDSLVTHPIVNQSVSEIPVISSEVTATSPITRGHPTTPGARYTFSHFLRSIYWSRTCSAVDASLLQCTILLLDGRVVVHHLQSGATGRELFELVTAHLKLEEPDHFGLAYYLPSTTGVHPITTSAQFEPGSLDGMPNDEVRSAPRFTRSKRVPLRCRPILSSCNEIEQFSFAYGPFWLNLDQKIFDQCHRHMCSFRFEVKFFAAHPERSLCCPNTRRQYYLQLRRHLSTGRLQCSSNVRVYLNALVAKMDFADFIARLSLCPDSVRFPHPYITNSYPPGQAISSAESLSLLSSHTCSLASPEPSDEEADAVWSYRSTSTSLSIHDSQSVQPYHSPIGTLTLDSKPIRHHNCSAVLSRLDGRFRTHTPTNANNRFLATLAEAGHPIVVSCPYHHRLTKIDGQTTLRQVIQARHNLRVWSYGKLEHHFLRCVGLLPLYGVESHGIEKCSMAPYYRNRPPSFWRKLHRHSLFDNMTHAWSKRKRRHSFTGSDGHQSDCGLKSVIPTLPSRHRFSLGISAIGVLIYWGQLRLRFYPWVQIIEVSTHRSVCKLFTSEGPSDSFQGPYNSLVWTFLFSSSTQCSCFYRSFVDYHRHFRDFRSKALSATCPLTPSVTTNAEAHSITLSTLTRSRMRQSIRVNRNLSHFLCWPLVKDRPQRLAAGCVHESSGSDVADMHSVSVPNTYSLDATTPCDVPELSDCRTGCHDEMPWALFSNEVQQDPTTASKSASVCHSYSVDITHPVVSNLLLLETYSGSTALRSSMQTFQASTCRTVASDRSASAVKHGPSSITSPGFDQSPSPRPKLPTFPRKLAVSTVTTSNNFTNATHFAVGDSSIATWRGPVVRTHSCVFSVHGKLTRLPVCAAPEGPLSATTHSSVSARLPYHPPAPFVVPTKSIYFPKRIPEVNQYLTLTTTGIHGISGCDVPRIATRSMYLRYSSPFCAVAATS